MKNAAILLRCKRVYDEASEFDGYRILTERLWPRGVSKERAHLDEWTKELAPSHELRTWFDHDPDKWESFKERYREELFAKRERMDDLLETIRRERVVTLVFASKEERYNSTQVLKEMLEDLLDSES